MANENPNPEAGTVNLFDPEVSACPQPVYRRMLEGCPVARTSLGGGAIISRYEDVTWALRHPEIFSSAMDLQIALGTERPMIPQQIDPPEQTKYRKLLDPRFSRKRMQELAPAVRADANQLIDGFIENGECEFDRDFAIPLPCNAFLHLMGLPPEELETFLRLKDGIIRPQMQTENLEETQDIRVRTGREIYAYFEDLIALRRKQPLDDLMTYLVTADLKGEKLSNDEILDICFLLLLAGLDTVTATLGCNIAYLAANPDQRQRIVAQPKLVEGAVEELLRWETPVTGVPRVLKQDVTLHGVEMKEGELVTLLLGASNTDDEEFGNAGDVDLERERNRHLAFGGGAHRCLGSHLARMELRVALEEWHKRIPDYEIKPGETPTYSPGIREVLYLPIVWPASS
ncbi:MAG: cytochrome P450 [Myxococcota bacterium]|nr:cytochrome P450 [Myxococcota bacterium]